MKVCVIGHTERNYLPYMEKYIVFFKKNNIDCDIICWEREKKPDSISKEDLNFYKQAKRGVFYKISSYLKFKKHVLNILNKKHYDKIIILTTVPAVFLKKYLETNYKNRYLFDFRDYSFEKFSFYRNMVDSLIENSEFTTISSEGFLDFLSPNKKIIINHNISYIKETQTVSNLAQKEVINIGFIGGVRYFDENTFLIEKLKNVSKYRLWYIGQPHPNCDLKSYCTQEEVTNVNFLGKYDNTQKPRLYQDIDMINSIYGNKSLEVTTALPNRLYEACLLKKPIISSKGTYLGEIIKRYGLGITINAEHDDVLQIINDYINNFNPDIFLKGCKKFLASVKNDEHVLYHALETFIEQKPNSDNINTQNQ